MFLPNDLDMQNADDAKNHIKEILETIPDAIVVIDEEGTIHLFNLASEPLFQYSSEEVIGCHISRLLPELESSVQISPNCMQTLNAVSQSGKKFPVEFSAGEMNFSSHRFLACVIRDISDRIKAEQDAEDARDQLLQAEKLASLGELVAGIAHEINTPLGISVTASSHLLEQYHKVYDLYRSNKLQRSALEHFFSNCEQSATILSSNLLRASELIRSFKQIAVDQSSNAARNINLQDYLDELLLSLRPQLKNRPIDVKIRCPENLLLNTYPGAISQILTNLIMNSLIHAFPEDTPGTITIDAEQEQERILIRYTDNGKGIAQDRLKRIFEPFYTTNRGSGSSGLGLHLAYNLATQTLGGDLSVHNAPSQGACFTLSFPVAQESPADAG